ncbi:hypothetical protein SELMODRAFT_446594 [Selaginella moellendorffii]|uniref:Uncharacterized protein POK-1 n=1 Tax=Selaginella moellendorffii TaxID=88036 RepID=D8SSR3_SELML|nr:vacuolar protein sorting-associated protein 52 A isoform X2 [Selaginella moellendorffii]XP_024518259.1 vacuolar protein sorting-associated protein 52 A isoform X2 [Selaginella moellendorffii]EFJ12526.1 hypothetical protein SELMODRAFT_446594 [Selaginella moellendorffii]|eukprot:XP_002986317.1 vacuolar protein sorting-associated protein 52 A isoform X2 [Selaginella moellendorffii]
MEAGSAVVEEAARRASAKLELPAIDDDSEEGSADTASSADADRPMPTAEELSQFAIEKLFASPLFASSDEKAANLEEPQSQAADLNATAGDLTFGEDFESEDISLEGLQEELESYQGREMVVNILGKGSELRAYARDVEEKLRQVELESIQDYIKESDNLMSLHAQIRECDSILTHMESLLGGFQEDLGSISSEIRSLQEQSMTMGLKLRNRKVAEVKLARFLEEIVLPPNMIDAIVDGEVNEEFVRNLQILSRKLQFIAEDPGAKGSAALRDVEPEFEKLRLRSVAKGRDYIIQRIYALRKPKTNIQILQQNVLLKYKYLATFLRDHGKEAYQEIRAAYIDTMNKVLSAHFKTYIQSLEKLQLDIATRNDLIGVEERAGMFSRGRENMKNKSAVFALGDRANVLKEIDQPAIIPHIAEASGSKFPYEVLFRSLHKLLMDTATSEYLFCCNFFGEDAIFSEIFTGPFSVIEDHMNAVLINCYDAIGLKLMIRITYQHQLIMSRRRVPCLDAYFDKLNILIWPRFKAVFDMHLVSLRTANVRTLWEDDVHSHYVMRRYAEFTASLLQINTEHGDTQLELNLERLRVAIDDLLVKLARVFKKQKQQTVFLINNYDMVLAVLREVGVDGGKTQQQFEELLKSSTTVFVEDLLREHFQALISFVKTRGVLGEESSSSTPPQSPVTVQEVEPLVKDFGERWKAAIELMHKDLITSFSNLVCGMEILRAALTQLLLYYTRLSDCIKRIDGAEALSKDLVSVASIMHEIKKYSRTF